MNPYQRLARGKRIEKAYLLLAEIPMSIAQLAERLSCSKITAWSYMQVLLDQRRIRRVSLERSGARGKATSVWGRA